MATQGTVVGIFTCPKAGDPMEERSVVNAIAGQGLVGDRYADGRGSFNKGKIGLRQVTISNARFFIGSPFLYIHSRRNLFFRDVEVLWLIGREFQVGTAIMRGVKYCDPCDRPSKLSGIAGFSEHFIDCGCIVAEVLKAGQISHGSLVTTASKGY